MSETEAKPRFCRAGHPLPSNVGNYCRLCAICSICKTPLVVSEYEFCLRQIDKAQREEDDALLPGESRRLVELSFSHPHCLTESEKHTLQTDTVTIPKTLFDKLNAQRLLACCIEPDENLNGKANADDAVQHLDRWIFRSGQNRTFEEHQNYVFMLLRRMEACAAFGNLALAKTRRGITEDHLKRDRDRFQIAIAERKAHENKAPHVEARKLSKEERAIEKMVKTLMSLNYSEAEARIEAVAKIQRNKGTIQ